MDLEPGVNWPICMRMFAHKDTLEPICTKIGYENVKVDDKNSEMSYEIPDFDEVTAAEQEVTDQASRDRHKVHVGSSEFKHLRDYDMNKLCARV